MLNMYGKTKIVTSKEFPVSTGQVIVAEGLVLMQVFEDGVEKVQPSNGAADSVFVGFTYGDVFTPMTKSVIKDTMVPASGPLTIELDYEPITGQIRIFDKTANAAIANGSSANAGEYTISGKQITFHAAAATHAIKITYRYAPTAMDLTFGDNMSLSSVTASEMISSVGCIQKGEVYTDMFDAASDWDSATEVRMGPGGILTASGSAAVIPGAVICHKPTADLPFLGIRVL